MMRFTSLQAIIDFVGEEYTVAYVPDAAQKILSRYDSHAKHYELKETQNCTKQ